MLEWLLTKFEGVYDEFYKQITNKAYKNKIMDKITDLIVKSS